MAVNVKALAEGQLPNAKGTLYTVPGATQAIIKKIVLVNEDTGTGDTESVNLYIKPGATSRRITPVNLQLSPGGMYVAVGPYTLEAGDLIEGNTTTATRVDYTIHGVEVA